MPLEEISMFSNLLVSNILLAVCPISIAMGPGIFITLKASNVLFLDFTCTSSMGDFLVVPSLSPSSFVKSLS